MTSIFGIINEETPKFDLVKKSEKGYEIRRYHRQLRASVEVPDTEGEGPTTANGFRELAGYIFGGNKKPDGSEKQKIAMTAPVLTETVSPAAIGENIAMTAPVISDSNVSNKTTTMSFILPSKYQSVEELPIPNDNRVKLEVIEPYTVAVLRFSGRCTPAVVDFQSKRLLEMLRDEKEVRLTVSSESEVTPKIARYNSPFTLWFLRTNEIMVPVSFSPADST